MCERLKALRPARSTFPLPQPLSLELAQLKNDEELLQDVWFEQRTEADASWLLDSSVRRGIRAMHMLDRCGEEDRRIRREARNLQQWYFLQRRAIEAALSSELSRSFYFLMLVKDLPSY